MRSNPRAELYFALSECYREPSLDFAGAVGEGAVFETVRERFAALGIRGGPDALRIQGPPEAVLRALREAYYPLFVVPPRFVLPVESVFKPWDEGLLAGARGLIMGPPAVDMIRRYRARGLAIPDAFKDRPDHIALLLEYGGLLCEEDDPALDGFVADHLDGWVEEFRVEVHACTADEFYRGVASATAAFVLAESRRRRERRGA